MAIAKIFKSKSFNVTLGLFLKEARLSKNLSQAHVAEHLGYSTSQFVSNWERGISMPPLSTLKKLVFLLEIDGHEIMGVILDAQKEILMQQLSVSDLKASRTLR